MRGVHDGGSGRNREQDRPGQAGGQGPLRAAAGGGEEDQVAARRLLDLPRQPRGEPRLADQGRRLHVRRDRDVARLQAEERGRPGAAASAPVGVRALFRYLTAWGAQKWPPKPPNVRSARGETRRSPHPPASRQALLPDFQELDLADERGAGLYLGRGAAVTAGGGRGAD